MIINPTAIALIEALQRRYHRLSCDLCGEDWSELRVIDRNAWVPDQITCRSCLTDPENDFRDLALAQGAMK